ncbi:MAG: ATP-binding cassette domain-containing protein [Haloferacaceae archaeon]
MDSQTGGTDPPAVLLDGLGKSYGDVDAVVDASFRVERGEVFGFLGPNGAGKSTTIRMLLGFTRPSTGEAYLLGERVRDREALRTVKGRVGYVPGDATFYEDLTGRELLDYFERLRGAERRGELEARFPAPFDRRVGTYSRGNRQKLALVQAFMHDPDLVVMDEPTSGLDPLVQNEFYEFLDAERAAGTTALFSSHILSEVRRVCDRVAVIRAGRVVAEERIDDLLEKGGKVVTVDLADRPSVDEFRLPGVVRAGYLDDGRLRLVCTGGYDALLDRLADHRVEDVEIRESSLEDVFMHFYEDGLDADGRAAEREREEGDAPGDGVDGDGDATEDAADSTARDGGGDDGDGRSDRDGDGGADGV